MCRWASSIHENLKFRGSDLEFQLLKSQFVSLLLNGKITEAIQHSKCQFQKFTEKNQKGNKTLVLIRLIRTTRLTQLLLRYSKTDGLLGICA